MLSPLSILRDSSKLTLAGVVGTALNFPASIIIANKLGPDLLGRASFVLLWVTYSGLVHIGIFEGAQREIVHNLGHGSDERARHYQNISLSGELLWALIPAGLLLAASFWFPDPVRRFGFVLAPLTYLGAALNRMLAGIHFAHRRFGLYSRLNLLRTTAQPVLLVVLAMFFGVYSLFIAPALVEWGMSVLYMVRAPSLEFAWTFHRKDIASLVRQGFPLAVQGLVFWAYRLIGVTSVALLLPAQQLGYYAFNARLIDLAIRPFSDFGAILMPTLWTELARARNVRTLEQDVSRLILLTTAVTCGVVNVLQFACPPAIELLLPRFVPGIRIFQVLCFNIVFLTMVAVPSLVLDSIVANRQWLHVSTWTVALIVNAAANIFVIQKGWGLIAVAWNDIWIQLVVAIVIYKTAERYIFESRTTARRFYIFELGLLLGCGAMFIALQWTPGSISPRAVADFITAFLVKISIVTIVWSSICFAMYRLPSLPFKKAAEPSL